MTEDGDLLRQYAQTDSEEAFSELVRRHLPLVYSAAVRQVQGNSAMAKDIAQSVFIDLAKKAHSLAEHELLAGWLYTSTRLAAAKAVRSEQRRQIRERIAASMHADDGSHAKEQIDLSAVLDEAMGKLTARDRNALLLRFFQGKDLKAVGKVMGVSEDAARMRVTRALGKLHVLVTRRGATLSAAGLGTLLAADAVSAAPPGLAASISAVAVTSAIAGAGTVTLLKALSLTKLKASVIAAVLVAGIVTPLVVHEKARVHTRTQSGRARIGSVQSVSTDSRSFAAERASVPPNGSNPEGRLSAGSQGFSRAELRAEGLRLRDQTAVVAHDAAAQKALALSKVALLKAWLKEMPEKDIPEIQLCTEADWLDVVNWAALDDETGARRALRGVRDRAKRRFGRNVLAAIRIYMEAHQQQLPDDLNALASLLDPPAAKALVERYELASKAKEQGVSAEDWVIDEKLSVDQDYDTVHHIGVYGITVQPISQDSTSVAKNNKL